MTEKVKNIKKTKQEQVFEILDKQGYILDNQSAKIFGESKLYCVSEHIRIWKKLHADQDFFNGKKVTEKRRGHRCHLIRLTAEPSNCWYKVGKEFWDTLNLNHLD